MKVLLVLHQGGSSEDHTETALSLAGALVRTDGTDVRLFLIGSDLTAAGLANRIGRLIAAGVEVRSGGPREWGDKPGDAAGMIEIEPSSIRGLSEWTVGSDLVLVF